MAIAGVPELAGLYQQFSWMIDLTVLGILFGLICRIALEKIKFSDNDKLNKKLGLIIGIAIALSIVLMMSAQGKTVLGSVSPWLAIVAVILSGALLYRIIYGITKKHWVSALLAAIITILLLAPVMSYGYSTLRNPAGSLAYLFFFILLLAILGLFGLATLKSVKKLQSGAATTEGGKGKGLLGTLTDKLLGKAKAKLLMPKAIKNLKKDAEIAEGHIADYARILEGINHNFFVMTTGARTDFDKGITETNSAITGIESEIHNLGMIAAKIKREKSNYAIREEIIGEQIDQMAKEIEQSAETAKKWVTYGQSLKQKLEQAQGPITQDTQLIEKLENDAKALMDAIGVVSATGAISGTGLLKQADTAAKIPDKDTTNQIITDVKNKTQALNAILTQIPAKIISTLSARATSLRNRITIAETNINTEITALIQLLKDKIEDAEFDRITREVNDILQIIGLQADGSVPATRTGLINDAYTAAGNADEAETNNIISVIDSEAKKVFQITSNAPKITRFNAIRTTGTTTITSVRDEIRLIKNALKTAKDTDLENRTDAEAQRHIDEANSLIPEGDRAAEAAEEDKANAILNQLEAIRRELAGLKSTKLGPSSAALRKVAGGITLIDTAVLRIRPKLLNAIRTKRIVDQLIRAENENDQKIRNVNQNFRITLSETARATTKEDINRLMRELTQQSAETELVIDTYEDIKNTAGRISSPPTEITDLITRLNKKKPIAEKLKQDIDAEITALRTKATTAPTGTTTPPPTGPGGTTTPPGTPPGGAPGTGGLTTEQVIDLINQVLVLNRTKRTPARKGKSRGPSMIMVYNAINNAVGRTNTQIQGNPANKKELLTQRKALTNIIQTLENETQEIKKILHAAENVANKTLQGLSEKKIAIIAYYDRYKSNIDAVLTTLDQTNSLHQEIAQKMMNMTVEQLKAKYAEIDQKVREYAATITK